MKFEFATAGRIVFGAGSVFEAGPAANAMGKRALAVTGSSGERAGKLFESLAAAGVEAVVYRRQGEPTTEDVEKAVERARAERCEVVIGFGGGSSIDLAKAVSALITNSGSLLDYLEVIGKGRKLERPAAPCIAIPTTAGTGAEATKNAVIASPERKVKVSLRSEFLLPRVAIVDPELTYGLPPDITAASGLDALTQLIEAFVTLKANPMSDAFCREGMARAARSLKVVFENGGDKEAREDMCAASLMSGLALANAGLGAVHGIAGPFGGMFNAPHGAVCGRLLPFVFEANVKALASRAPGSKVLGRFDEIAMLLTGGRKRKAADAVRWINDLCKVISVPGLGSYGMTEADIPAVVEKSQKASSMKGNPVILSDDDLRLILAAAM
jgi:alcohol dehydrogenase class IV